jgi:hypothetical protein
MATKKKVVEKPKKVEIKRILADGVELPDTKGGSISLSAEDLALPREQVVSGTQQYCDEVIRKLKMKYKVETLGLTVSSNQVTYTLKLS